jgi:putative PIN family toxin of toxin-antitoxin system
MSTGRWRVVLDTSVVVTALRSRAGASNLVLRKVAAGRLQAVATTALLLEYEAVLKRPEQRLVTGLRLDDIERILGALARVLEPVDVYFQWRPQLADPSDELVLEAAVNGRANAIVTHNVRDFAPATTRFRLSVLRPADLAMRLRS